MARRPPRRARPVPARPVPARPASARPASARPTPARLLGLLAAATLTLCPAPPARGNAPAEPPAPDPAAAAAIATAALCDAAAATAAAESGVPLEVLRAITRTETGRRLHGATRPWPWTVNMEGRGVWFASRTEAVAYAEAERARGARSFDMGCFQINYRWHGQHFASLDAMMDPLQSARYAARYLAALFAERGDWLSAAGRYHSATSAFAERYKLRFRSFLAQLPPMPDASPLPGLAPTLAALPADPDRAPPRYVRLPATPGAVALVLPAGPADAAGLLRPGRALLAPARPLLGPAPAAEPPA
jgi:hypothetical protein